MTIKKTVYLNFILNSKCRNNYKELGKGFFMVDNSLNESIIICEMEFKGEQPNV